MAKNVPSSSRERSLTFGLFFGYGIYSLLRKSFSVSVPFMRSTLGLTKSDVGNIATSFSISYGISKFVGGVVSDFLPPDILFSVGLFLAGLSNLLFSYSTQTTVLCALWFLNGIVQGCGWPALSQIVTSNVDPSRAGTTWSILVSGSNLGYLLGPFLLLPFAKYGWEVPFRICGLAGMVSACIVYIILSSAGSRKEAEAVGNEKGTACKVYDDSRSHANGQTTSNGQQIDSARLPTTNRIGTIKTKNCDAKTESGESSGQLDKILECPANMKGSESNIESVDNVDKIRSKSEILIRCLFSVNLWLVMIVGGLTTFVLKSMSDWTGLFLVEHFSLSITQSTELMLWNEMGGMVGTLLCGVLSDFLGGRKYLTLLIFTAICIFGVVYFPSVFPISLQVIDSQSEISLSLSGPFVINEFALEMFVKSFQNNTLALSRSVHSTFSGHIGAARICLFLMGFGINGPKTLLGVMVRDLVPREVSGTVGGIFGLISQVGASASGAGLGHMLEEYGWESFMTLLLSGIVAIGICLIFPVITLNSPQDGISKKRKSD